MAFWVHLGLHLVIGTAVLNAGIQLATDPALLRPDAMGPTALLIGVAMMAASLWARLGAVATPRPAQPRELVQPFHADALTGQTGAPAFLRAVAESLENRRATAGAIAVARVDLRGFGALNADLGSAAADLLLRQIGVCLARGLRADDVIARHGPDEFALLLVGMADPETVADLAGRLQQRLSVPFEIDGLEIGVRADVGIALSPGDATTAEALIDAAGAALERAKADIKAERVCFFDRGIEATLIRRRQRIDALGEAIGGPSFDLVYASEVDLDSGRIIGFEVQVQWPSGPLAAVDRAEILELAEQHGWMPALAERLIGAVAAHASHWSDKGHEVRLRLRFPHAAMGLWEAVLVALEQRRLTPGGPTPGGLGPEGLVPGGLVPDGLSLEMTGRPGPEALQMMRRLHEIGVRLAIGDVSRDLVMADLAQLPVDEIAMTVERGGGPMPMVWARAAGQIADDVGLDALARGLETKAQRQRYRALGFTVGQGPVFGPALTPAEVSSLLEAVDRQPDDDRASRGERREAVSLN